MYSLLLMSAMAGTPDAAAFGWRRDAGCHGCTGGAVAASCYGSACYGSCYGSSHGSACYGSCYGSSCYGSACYGSSCQGDGGLFRGGLFSRLGGRKASSCHGSTACYGSCHGGACYGSCHGAGCHGAAYHGSGCHGAGCSGCGGVIVGVDLPGVPVVEGRTVAAAVADIPATPATITVELPASAKLYVDGVLTTATGTTRQFHTPELAAGKAFYYEMKAEVVVNGRTEVEEKRVVVRAGATLTESFPKLLVAAAADAAVASATK